jgi:hypothetical protein
MNYVANAECSETETKTIDSAPATKSNDLLSPAVSFLFSETTVDSTKPTGPNSQPIDDGENLKAKKELPRGNDELATVNSWKLTGGNRPIINDDLAF